MKMLLTKILRKLRRPEGQSLVTQMLILVPVLLLMIGLIFDLGAVAIAQAAGQDAADLAVQDAVKHISRDAFYTNQEVAVSVVAFDLAARQLDVYSRGQARLLGLWLVRPDDWHLALWMEAEIEIPLRFLRLVGIPTVKRRIRASAVPAFGIRREGE
jgi:hypothetical protein